MGLFIRRARWMAILAICLGLTGCRSPVDMPPKDIVTRSIDGLSGEDHFAFKGMTEIRTGEREVLTKKLRFEGQVQHHEGLHMRLVSHPEKENTTTTRWNPIRLLEQLGEAKTTVERVESNKSLYTLNAGEGMAPKERGVTEPTFPLDEALAFRIHVDPTDAKKMFEERLWQDYELVVIPRKKVLEVQNKLSKADAAQLEMQLNQAASSHRSNLKSLLRSCKVDAQYLLWVDRKSQLPLRLDGKMKVYYNGKKSVSETIRTVSEFTRTR